LRISAKIEPITFECCLFLSLKLTANSSWLINLTGEGELCKLTFILIGCFSLVENFVFCFFFNSHTKTIWLMAFKKVRLFSRDNWYCLSMDFFIACKNQNSFFLTSCCTRATLLNLLV
jgi:hypothetical protein